MNTLPDHNSGKVNGRHGVEDDEDPFVVDILDAVPQPDGEDAGEDVEVEEEGEPSRRLVF